MAGRLFGVSALISALVIAAAAGCGGSTGSNDGVLGPAGSSSSSGSSGGSSSGSSGGTTDGTNYDTPTVCTSGTTWTRGDTGSSKMHPGVACITCHKKENGPTYYIAGTVYPTAHEPDDCNGLSTIGASVVITGADGNTLTLAVNSVGNFYSGTKVATPYKAKVVVGTSVREMTGAQTNGDCNSCHTTDGTNNAPGRIMAP